MVAQLPVAHLPKFFDIIEKWQKKENTLTVEKN